MRHRAEAMIAFIAEVLVAEGFRAEDERRAGELMVEADFADSASANFAMTELDPRQRA
jgi:hypothetical protein